MLKKEKGKENVGSKGWVFKIKNFRGGYARLMMGGEREGRGGCGVISGIVKSLKVKFLIIKL